MCLWLESREHSLKGRAFDSLARSLDRAPKKTKSRQETEQWSEGGMLFMMGVHVDDFMRVPCVVSLQHVAHSIDGFGISTWFISSRRRSSLVAVPWLMRLRLIRDEIIARIHCETLVLACEDSFGFYWDCALMWRSNKRSQQSHARRSRQHFCLLESRNR